MKIKWRFKKKKKILFLHIENRTVWLDNGHKLYFSTKFFRSIMSVAIKEKKRKNMMNRFLNLRLQRKFKLNMTIQ